MSANRCEGATIETRGPSRLDHGISLDASQIGTAVAFYVGGACTGASINWVFGEDGPLRLVASLLGLRVG